MKQDMKVRAQQQKVRVSLVNIFIWAHDADCEILVSAPTTEAADLGGGLMPPTPCFSLILINPSQTRIKQLKDGLKKKRLDKS